MSREIKFRAWHKQAKSMAGWDVLRSLLFGDSVRWPVQLQNNRPYPETITFFEIRNANIFENTALEVMQFTGLKDSEGVEIYEGDIVDIWYRDGSGNHRNEAVIYREDSACFDTRFVEDWLRATFTVIGNIHQHSELLADHGKWAKA